MRHILFLLGVVFLALGSLNAQSSPTNPLLLAAPFSMSSTGAVSADSAAAVPSSSTSFSGSTAANSSEPVALTANPFSTATAATPTADPQHVQGVFTNYNWQGYLG